ncbi:MAG: hypothetical protein CM1200mP2_54880 [Planctomycetaceae bacterium]|nr:MAG: hypothetical protein CM1200mP2_54880 [Planctomycetaceae bacterium]
MLPILNGLAMRLFIPYAGAEIYDARVDGHKVGRSAVDGYIVQRGPGTIVQFNIPPKKVSGPASGQPQVQGRSAAQTGFRSGERLGPQGELRFAVAPRFLWWDNSEDAGTSALMPLTPSPGVRSPDVWPPRPILDDAGGRGLIHCVDKANSQWGDGHLLHAVARYDRRDHATSDVPRLGQKTWAIRNGRMTR